MYLVLDLETTIKTGYGRKGNPFLNRIVAFALKNSMINISDIESNPNTIMKSVPGTIKTIIGHNLKFDLLYLWKSDRLQYMFQEGLKIWDTQLAEYILSGQQHKYPALRDIAVNKYGCDEREKVMEPYWEKGICTAEIPQDLVIYDVKNDVADTESVYLQQLERADELGMLTYIEAIMDGLLATTEAEYNGLYVSKQKLLQNKALLEKDLERHLHEFLIKIKPYWTDKVEFSVTNPGMLSVLLFGGIIKHEVVEPMIDEEGNPVVFKTGVRTGELKTRKATYNISINGLKIYPSEETARAGIYQTNEESLLDIQKKVKKGIGFDVVSMILEIRGINKQLSTYYDNVLELIYEDALLHPTFNHVSTDTGRLSAGNPNVQNQPHAGESLVQQHFTSRFEGGKLIAGDYSQIEIVVQAELSGDPIYIQDVKDGVDFHTKRLAMSEGCEYKHAIEKIQIQKDPEWIEKRKKIKTFSFQRAYGAGSWLISQTIGLPQEQIEELIKLEELEYCGLKEYNDQLESIVKATAERISGTPLSMGWYKTFTGKRYYTKQRYNRKTGSPEWVVPQIKNYGIQGTAFDVAIIMLGRYWRNNLIHNRDKYLFINMVHDSFMLDSKPEFVQEAGESLQYLTKVKEMCTEVFDYEFKLDVKLDVKSGNSWYEV